VFAADFDLFREHFKPGAVLINGLGLTEANGNVCHFRLTHEMRISGLIMPIGKSNEGIEIKLLDDDRGEVVAGEIGEIVVRGKQVSPAYWTGSAVQQHGLDREGFRTGDLGCRNSQGFLEYFGRKDGQLKLRGQWISIAEVEAALTRIPSVRDAAVVSVDTARQTEKIAAFVSWSQRPLPEQELRRALGQQLPSYSVPNYFFSLRQLPLLPNGKVDRRALSQRARQGLTAKTKARFDPSDLITLELVRLWRNVLESDSLE
jgi:acyl-CoA synthetase (AMP-forming)/AMP-acid ligase II